MESERCVTVEEKLSALVTSNQRTAEACESLRSIMLWVWVFVPLIVAAVASMFVIGYAISVR